MIKRLIQGNCLKVMDDLIAEGIKVDAIITDPPYGTTACKWDAVIPFNEMWDRLNKLIKPNGAIALFGSQPFTSKLICSNINGFAFCWVWDKCFAGNFVQAKRQPLKDHEDIAVFTFSGKQPNYYPQMIQRDKSIKKCGNKQSNAIPIAQTDNALAFGKLGKIYEEKFPNSQIRFNSRAGRGLHSTQKPVALMEYLVKTYTNEGETILDFTCGSGSTIVACNNLNRGYIGIDNGLCDKDKEFTCSDGSIIHIKGIPWASGEGVSITQMRLDGLI